MEQTDKKTSSQYLMEALEDGIDEVENVLIIFQHKDGSISFGSNDGRRTTVYALANITSAYCLADITSDETVKALPF